MRPYLIVIRVSSDPQVIFPTHPSGSPCPSFLGSLREGHSTQAERIQQAGQLEGKYATTSEDKRAGPVYIEWMDLHPGKDIPFTSGATPLVHGELHLYREGKTLAPGTPCTLVCLLDVPLGLAPADLLSFLSPSIHTIRQIRLLRDSSPHRYMALCSLVDGEDAASFIDHFDGQPFSDLDPEICHVVPVSSVSLIHAGEVIGRSDGIVRSTKRSGSGSNNGGLSYSKALSGEKEAIPLEQLFSDGPTPVELPTCPVCLERMDATATGLISVMCRHTFHCKCMLRWESARCPVCRFYHGGAVEADTSITPSPLLPNRSTGGDRVECVSCESRDRLWMCLVCGHIGCGRYTEAHAWRHYEMTGHVYAQEVETQRVWDYAGDVYVHRILQNRADGKLVELPPSGLRGMGGAEGASGEGADGMRDSPYGMWGGREAGEAADKVDAMALEYTALLSGQLEAQRDYYEARLVTELAEGEARYAEMEVEVTSLRERHARGQEKEKKMELLLRRMGSDLQEERELGKGIRENHRLLQEAMEQQKEEVEGLREQVHDLMTFLDTRDRITNGEMGEVDVDAPVELRPTPSPKKGKGKGKGKR